MRTQSLVRSCIITIALLACQLATVNSVRAQGWPDASAPASKSEPKKADPVVAPVKPAKKTASSASPATAAKTETVVAKPAAAKAPVVESAPSDLVQALQRQSDVLSRLATELQTQRAVIVEQQEKIKALEARSVAATASPAVIVTPAPATSETPAPMPAITVDTGGMKLRMSGLFQGWYTAGSGGTVDTFRMRRAELKFSGDMGAKAKWVVVVDPAKALSLTNTVTVVAGTPVISAATLGQSGNVLQDAFLSLSPTSTFSVELGQQKLPLSLEGSQSSARLETIDRALFMTDKARGGVFGDVRDLGVMARGTLFKGQFEYASGLFNGLGESMNDTDKNDQKAFVTRIVLRPAFVRGLQFGGSFARDEFGALATTLRVRQGLEALYTYKTFAVKSELMTGSDGPTTRKGGYFQVTDRFVRSLQAVFRIDGWDPDTHSDTTAANVAEKDYLGGVTYFVTKSGVILQVNYIHKTFMDISPAKNVFMANLQTAW